MDFRSDILIRLERLSPTQRRLLVDRIELQRKARQRPADVPAPTSVGHDSPEPGRVRVPTDCLHEQFERQVRRVPNAVAVQFENQQVRYSELNKRAMALADRLREIGVGPESRVAILLDRSIDLVVAVLGVLKAGGAYVPIDPTYPDERIAHLVNDADPAVIVTSSRLASRLTVGTRQLLIDSSIEAANGGESQPASAVRATSRNLAYILYTSGSTGSPKGVMVTHESVLNVLAWVIEQVPLTERDVVLSLATFCFDISVAEMFLPLSVGARLVMVGRETAMDGIKLARLIEESGATFIQPTPATYRLLLEAGWNPKPGLTMVSTGERLSADLGRQLAGRGPALWNLYGPTETTIWSTGIRIDDPAESITIGHPVANTRTYILDARMAPVSSGTPGELFIGGDGVARGYFGRADLTAERFVPDPFSPVPGARMYRTGDLARFLVDGRIDYLGRLDHQVKIRGYRIELGEIEATFVSHPRVSAAVVLAREADSDDPRLAAFLVTRPGFPVSVAELREFLKCKLPDHMVPTEMALVKGFPLTANGKVDRRALLSGPTSAMEPIGEQSSSRSQTQQQMIDIWRELLNVESVGLEDDFFDLGGHSLLAMRLVARVERTFGVAPPLRSLFERSTLAAFSDCCDDLLRVRASVPEPVEDRIEGRI